MVADYIPVVIHQIKVAADYRPVFADHCPMVADYRQVGAYFAGSWQRGAQPKRTFVLYCISEVVL